MHATETFLHEHFKEQRVKGEWFELTDEQAEGILNLIPTDQLYA